MGNYYNENDPKAVTWLRGLIDYHIIPEGEIDERSICDVQPNDLRGFTQCHFFAGIGGWSRALQLAGWPQDHPVWTGSCPCQPFSVAGKGAGTSDARHLWPEFFRLIKVCHPPTVFGEQVASKAGREWLAGVFADLEGVGYSRAGADLCAASVGAPHRRQRLFWVAHSSSTGLERWQEQFARPELQAAERGGGAGDMENPRHQQTRGSTGTRETNGSHFEFAGSSFAGELGQPNGARRKQGQFATTTTGHGDSAEPAGFWSDFQLITCRDGKTRRSKSDVFPLAHGIPGRVGLLRGYGNAIVPQVAAGFIQSTIEAIYDTQI